MKSYNHFPELNLMNGECVWDIYATHGFPIEFMLEIMWEHKLLPTWDRLLLAAKKDGTNMIRLRDSLIFYASQIYPKDISKCIKERLALLPT